MDNDGNDDDNVPLNMMLIGIKSCLFYSTFYDERENLLANWGLVAWQHGRPVYHKLDAEGDKQFR